jgi:hypothetical protein
MPEEGKKTHRFLALGDLSLLDREMPIAVTGLSTAISRAGEEIHRAVRE